MHDPKTDHFHVNICKCNILLLAGVIIVMPGDY